MKIKVRLAAAVLTTLTATAIGAGSAGAGTFADSASSCDGRTLSRPFLPWLDPMKYTFAPNGGFESGANQWKLTGGASVVAGNESYDVHSSADSRSLYLPAGSSATSRPICVELLDPTLRFFALDRGGLLSFLKVEALFETPLGGVTVLPVGVVAGSSSWRPTLPMLALGNLTSILDANGESAVAFRFTPIGFGAKWQIDDVYVDPVRNR